MATSNSMYETEELVVARTRHDDDRVDCLRAVEIVKVLHKDDKRIHYEFVVRDDSGRTARAVISFEDTDNFVEGLVTMEESLPDRMGGVW